LITAVASVYATDPAYAQLVSAVAGQANVLHAIAQAHVALDPRREPEFDLVETSP